MKVRNGFVSNSSSSSFILKKNENFPNSYSLAASMIKIRDWDNDKYLIEKMIEKVEKGEGYENISFNSCNYDTYIVDVGDYLLCNTCNNHNHYEITNYGEHVNSNNLPDDIKNEYIDKEYGDINLRSESFWFLEHDIKTKESENYSEFCHECYCNYLLIDGEYKCPNGCKKK